MARKKPERSLLQVILGFHLFRVADGSLESQLDERRVALASWGGVGEGGR